MSSPFSINVNLYGYTAVDFDRRPVRKALLKSAREVRKEARRNLSRAAVSAPGEFPGLDSGDLRRSISAFSKGRGFVAIVAPKRTGRMAGRKFFPTILIRGTKDHRIEGRADPIAAALESRRATIQTALTAALESALRIR